MRRTFQSVQLVRRFTVLENVLIGMQTRFGRTSLLGRLGLGSAAEREAQAAVRDVLGFLGIADKILVPLERLTFAEQRLTEIARAIVSRPKLLLLDEPAAGLSPNEVTAFDRLLRQLRDEWGMTILLVEHVLSLVLSVSDGITVLENGRVIADGTPKQHRRRPVPCAPPISAPMLSVRQLCAGYGSIRVLRQLSLEVPRGRIVALLGGNGAGKTTTMHALAGLIPSTAGEVLFEGKRLNGLPAHRIFARGLALVAQGRQLFPGDDGSGESRDGRTRRTDPGAVGGTDR